MQIHLQAPKAIYIEMFPEEERKDVLALVDERRLEHSITHRKP